MKISIICVCLNSQETIYDCLFSISNQTYRDFELIIIDGNSTDKTLSIINNFKKEIPKIKILSEKDQGVYDAMNKGIKIADGEIIAFLNSDDFYSNKDVLNQIFKIFNNNPKIDGCYSDLVYVERKKTKKKLDIGNPNII